LHEQIVAQSIMIIQIFVATTKRVYALGQQVAQPVLDTTSNAPVIQRSRRCAAQADTFIDLAKQQQTAIRTQVAPAKIRANYAPSHTPKLNRFFGTLWHRQIQLFVGLEHQ
jgi:hypothetical protein